LANDKSQSTYDEIVSGLGGTLADFEPFHNYVLVGVYMKGTTRQLAGGQTLYIPDKSADEDRWQGKAAVVLKKGPRAFMDDDIAEFGGVDVAPGDWVMFRVTDGYSLDLNGVHCRLLQDTELRGRVKDPTTIY
jgi:co-chaperonin GroES (HSP10)